MACSNGKLIELMSYHRKRKNHCIFCNQAEELRFFKKHFICSHCLESIRTLYYDGFFQKIKEIH